MARSTRTRKVAVDLPEMETAADRWGRHIRIPGLAVTVLGLIVVGLVVLAPNLRELVDQQRQIAELERQKQDAQGSVDQLNSQIARWDDPAYVEAQARERLYYVQPGEYDFLVTGGTDADAATDEPAPVSDQVQTTQTDWVAGALASLVEAGTTTKTPEELSTR